MVGGPAIAAAPLCAWTGVRTTAERRRLGALAGGAPPERGRQSAVRASRRGPQERRILAGSCLGRCMAFSVEPSSSGIDVPAFGIAGCARPAKHFLRWVASMVAVHCSEIRGPSKTGRLEGLRFDDAPLRRSSGGRGDAWPARLSIPKICVAASAEAAQSSSAEADCRYSAPAGGAPHQRMRGVIGCGGLTWHWAPRKASGRRKLRVHTRPGQERMRVDRFRP